MKKTKPKTTITEPEEITGKELIKSANLFPVVGVGASAGGLDAFKKLLQVIPEDSGMAYVLVQHLDPNHESMLPEILQKVTRIPVLEITDDIKVQPNHIYIIPSNKMMVATDGVLLLAPRPAKNKTERNLPIDLFFTSLAEVHQAHAIGVVLSGTATDGTLGLKAIKDHGGITFAQDESSAEYEGMPNSAVQAGVVDFVLPPEEIPQKLSEVTKIISAPVAGEQPLPLEVEEVFRQILALLRIRKGTDFTYYKQTTIRRRILRRMALNQNEEPAGYLKYLREKKAEQDALYQDLLIPVTSFFRDKKSFENLCDKVFPLIVKNRTSVEPVRVWVAGCSTGEEAYSIAICFKEFLAGHDSASAGERIQIFATDLSEPAIVKARQGIYTKLELAAVSPVRLKDFFTKTNGSYQINRQVRDMCVFAHHNFLKDPPFGKMDFISCRNVLIYMEPYLQKKALTTFHYALNPGAFMLLGKSETISGVPDLFASTTIKDKLFTRKDVPGRFMLTASPRSEQNLQDLNAGHRKDSDKSGRTDFQKTADDLMLSKYTPAGVVVNEEMNIVHFRGKTGNYLEQSPGKPSHNLLVMAKHGLAFELRNLLHKAKKDKVPVIKENIPVEISGNLRNISIEAQLLPNTIESHYLVLFHDSNFPDSYRDANKATGNKKTVTTKSKEHDKDLRIQQLEQELAQIREDMRSITEVQEASNEELQSANEELLSGSEELQSLNEELETSKEELQSTNEELTVVNQEMIDLNEQISAGKNYAESIVANIREPLLVLDKNLRIKTANKSFYKTFRVNEQETEGVLIYDLGNKQWNIPELRTLLEKILPEKSVFGDFEVTHTFTSIGERIMLLNAREVLNRNNLEKLILLSIEDVTEQRHSQLKEKKFLSRFHSLLLQTPTPISIFRGSKYVVELVNDAGLGLLVRDKSFIGKLLFEAMPELENPIKEIFDNIMQSGIPFIANEMEATLFRNGRNETGWFNVNWHPIREDDNTVSGILAAAVEVTDQVVARKKIADSEKRYNLMLMKSPFAFAVLKGKNMVITLANDSVKEVWGKGKDLEGKPLLEVLPEIKDSAFPGLLDKVYTTGIPFYGNELLAPILRNGKLEDVYFKFVYQPYLEADETISGVTIIAIDVTNEVLAKQKIKDSQQQLQNIFMQAPFSLNIYEGKELVISLANKLFCEIIGKTESEILGKKLFDAFPETAEGLDKILSDIFSTGIPFKANEFPVHFLKQGNEFKGYFDFIYEPIFDYNKNVSAVINVAIDVTDKVLARKKIEESEQRFHNLIYTSPSAIGILLGEDLVITIANEPIIEIWGKGKEIIGKKYFEALPELAEQGYKEVFNQVYKTGIPFNAIETPVSILQNGVTTRKYYNFILYPQKNINGEINGIGIIATEVTSQAKYNLRIKESEERFRSLVEKAPYPICIFKGKELKMEVASEFMLKIYNVGEEVLGTPFLEILPEMKEQPFIALLLDVLENGTTHSGSEQPAYFLRKNGEKETYYFNFVYQPYRENDGAVSGVMVLATEVTEQVIARKKIEESEKKFKQLAELMPQKVWTADANGNKIYFNKTLLDFAGKTLEELKGDGWKEMIHPDDWEQDEIKWKESVSTGKKYQSESRFLRKDGKYLWHLTLAIPLKDDQDNIILWIGSKTEIQEQRKQKEILEELVTNRTAELKQANEELVKMNKELEAFTYVSSHDLQEPLRKIQTFAGRILENENPNLSENEKNYFHRMRDAAQRMQALIQDLLAFSRLSTADREFKNTDLGIIIDEVKKEFEEAIAEKRATIEVNQICEVHIIPFQFRQLMQNLIGNALKFSNPDRPPHIKISSVNIPYSKLNIKIPSSQKEYCHISISDNGIGFEKEFSEKIFEVFQRLHAKDEYAGTGIGLAIVKKIVDNHNGIITATGKLNEGATFDIYIPVRKK